MHHHAISSVVWQVGHILKDFPNFISTEDAKDLQQANALLSGVLNRQIQPKGLC
jgi:hypothetical protein